MQKSAHVANRANGPPYAQSVMSMDSDDGISYKAIGGTTGQLLEQNAQALDQISANFAVFKNSLLSPQPTTGFSDPTLHCKPTIVELRWFGQPRGLELQHTKASLRELGMAQVSPKREKNQFQRSVATVQ
ncbi:hypothetical protein HAX54_024513 [Datura stramonium]|uniref:Uncharacterized protein n=1 Tax=Datura stramonium TaxID=4076 RepID=A0ABS8UY76_DATST|nr:hypothetical protein [Datura stramonium]